MLERSPHRLERARALYGLGVARLAAAGRSEREIAQELFVTPRMLQDQLKRIYEKLGVEGPGSLSAGATLV